MGEWEELGVAKVL